MQEIEDIELIINIMKARQDLIVANSNFQTAEDELVDYYSYQIKANKAKLDYLIKKVKQKGVTMNVIKKMEISLYSHLNKNRAI